MGRVAEPRVKRGRRPVINAELGAKLRTLYETGLRIRELADIAGTSYGATRAAVVRAGGTLRSRGRPRIEPDEADQMVIRYVEDLWTMKAIALEFGCSYTTVRNVLLARGVRLRSKASRQRVWRRPRFTDPDVVALYDWLAANGVDELVPQDPTFEIDEEAGTFTYSSFVWAGERGWNLEHLDVDGAVLTGQRTVPLLVPPSGRVLELLERSQGRTGWWVQRLV